MALFKTENLTFSYPKCDKKALDGVSLEIKQGEFVLVTGESGSGKSTLLRLMKKELAPYGKLEGDIIIRSKSTAFVSQSPDNSFVCETVRGEIAFALENRGLENNEIALRLGEISSFFNINTILDSRLCELSGGEKSAVSIAAAMIDNADTLILDEPFAQLDLKAVISVTSMLKRINEELGVTIIMSSHSMAETAELCDKLIILEGGRIKFCGDIRNAAESEELLGFFPACTRLFERRPLTVKEALPYADLLKEKSLEHISLDKPCVTLKDITFAYDKKSPDILSRLTYTAYEGKINAVIGGNGSGKTTLLKLIGGIKKPYSGKVKVGGRVGYMPQEVRCLFKRDTVAEEISLQTAKALGIDDCLSQHPFDLSGGQAQKLALGILLEQNADILLLDEPSRAFDYKSKNTLAQMLKSLCHSKKTVILVSHDIDFVGEVADCVSFLSDGVISVAGGRREVFSSLKFYTTQVRRITAGTLENAVSTEDVL